MPHIYDPTQKSLYSSNNKNKKGSKEKALYRATIENLQRHNKYAWAHVARKEDSKIVTKRIVVSEDVDLTIQLYTIENKSLYNTLPKNDRLAIIKCEGIENTSVPQYASQKLLEQAEYYDILGYMEDDLAIEDSEFFNKLLFMMENLPTEYTVIPHRCEWIEGKGEVILSGDPEGGRNDLYWDTGEKLRIGWGNSVKTLYRATNPHSGCFFLSRKQGIRVRKFWEEREWKSPYMLSGPLEHAASGRLIEVQKIMKTIPEDYRFLKVKHCDELWKRHEFIEHQIID